MKFKAIWSMAMAFTKSFFRNKVALFFTFLFPLIFLVVFGFIFGHDDQPSFNVGLIDQSETLLADQFEQIAQDSEIFEFENEGDLEEFKIQLGRGEIDAIIILPKDFGQIGENGYPEGRLELLYDQGDEQLSLTIIAVLEGIFDEINKEIVPIDRPLTIVSQPLQTANLSRFDYVFAGLIGFSILSLGIFSMSEGFIQEKKSKALMRIRLAPIKAWQLIAATVFNRVLVGLIAVALMFAAGVLIFKFNMRGDYLSFLIFSVISLVCLLGFGTFIAGWAKDSNQAAPLANLISFPMMFLSGVFFPVFLMPNWLQQVTTFIPLTAVNDGLRLILTEGYTIFELGPQLLIILVWSLLLYTLASRTFRWE